MQAKVGTRLFVVDRIKNLDGSAALGLTDMAVEYGFFELDGQHGDDPGNDWDGSLCDLEELEECEEGDETWDEDLRPPTPPRSRSRCRRRRGATLSSRRPTRTSLRTSLLSCSHTSSYADA
ncbi:hypothetical protein DIPPA_06291 [Diplonema papillatum]|nr:hypothetical protein DIPPA_06291 [Diplonema papillatum]